MHGDFDDAIRQFETEISINPLFWMAYYRLGGAYTRKDQWDEAVAPLQKAIWLDPDFNRAFKTEFSAPEGAEATPPK